MILNRQYCSLCRVTVAPVFVILPTPSRFVSTTARRNGVFTRRSRRSDCRRDRSHVCLREATVGAIICAVDGATGRAGRLSR